MTQPDNIAAARDQLNRTLAFFPRVDTKASVLLAVDTSMLAFLTSKAAPSVSVSWLLLPIAIAACLLAFSLWHLYREAFPALDGGEESNIYFREISKRTEAKYVEAWTKMSESDYLNDLLGQVWRNSHILTDKFNHVLIAFNCLALAITPWLIAIAWLSWNAAQVPK